MKKTINTKYFTYIQNNSGGYFVLDKEQGIAKNVIIEAVDADHANTRAENIGLYFGGMGDCSCCGDRWQMASSYDAAEEPEIYGESFKDFLQSSKNITAVAIHYIDGKIEVFGDCWDD